MKEKEKHIPTLLHLGPNKGHWYQVQDWVRPSSRGGPGSPGRSHGHGHGHGLFILATYHPDFTGRRPYFVRKSSLQAVALLLTEWLGVTWLHVGSTTVVEGTPAPIMGLACEIWLFASVRPEFAGVATVLAGIKGKHSTSRGQYDVCF